MRADGGGAARTSGERVDRGTDVRELYQAEYGRLAGWTNKLVGDPDLAHDITTECFVRLMAKWRTVSTPRPWLYMTATNLVRDHWRRQQRERKALTRLAEPPASQPAHDPTLRDLVQQLPERMRTVVLLHYYADLPVHDIAGALGKSPGTIKRALFDARAKLSKHLSDADLDTEPGAPAKKPAPRKAPRGNPTNAPKADKPASGYVGDEVTQDLGLTKSNGKPQEYGQPQEFSDTEFSNTERERSA